MLDHIIVLYLIFRGHSILFSINAAPIYIPTNTIHRYSSLFFHILPILFSFFFFLIIVIEESFLTLFFLCLFFHQIKLGSVVQPTNKH